MCEAFRGLLKCFSAVCEVAEVAAIGVTSRCHDHVGTRCGFARKRRGPPEGGPDPDRFTGPSPADENACDDWRCLRRRGPTVAVPPPHAVPIHAVEQHGQLGSADLDAARSFGRREVEGSLFQPLVPDGQPVAVPVQDLEPVAALAASWARTSAPTGADTGEAPPFGLVSTFRSAAWQPAVREAPVIAWQWPGPY